MAHFYAGLNAMNEIMDAYNNPDEAQYQPPTKKKPIQKTTTKSTTQQQVKKPIKSTTTANRTKPQPTTTIGSKTTTKQPVKQQQQQQQKPKPGFQQAHNTVKNIQNSYNNPIQQQQQNKSNNSLSSNQNISKNSSKNSSLNNLDQQPINNNNNITIKFTKNQNNNNNNLHEINLSNIQILKSQNIPSQMKSHKLLLQNAIFNDDPDLPIFDFSEKKQNFQDISTILSQKKEYIDIDFMQSQQYNWKNLQDILPNTKLFNNIQSEAIVQGSLGDCYLISSLGCLSENPFNITRLFQNKAKNNQGVYQVFICESGAWKKILLDDYFPFNQNNYPQFCNPKYGDTYGMLLEKAYAKLYGGYKNIEVGLSADALRDLTGAVSEYIDIKKNGEKSWQDLKQSLSQNFLLTVSSGSSDQMVNNHCYGILDLKSIKSGSKTYNFIKIRNPYGSIGGQDMINKLPQSVIQQLNEPVKQIGGILWMYYEDFRKNFEVVTVSKIHQGYNYSFMQFQQQQQSNQILLAQVHKPSNAYFSIHQKHSRFFDKDYKYSTKRIIIAKIDETTGEIIKVLNGDFNCRQACHVQVQLEQGSYIVYGECDFQQNNTNKIPYTISCYSESPVSLQKASNIYNLQSIQEIDLVKNLVLKYTNENQNIPDCNINNYQNPNDQSGKTIRKYGPAFGYVYIMYNNSHKNSTFYETIDQFVNFQNLHPYTQKLLPISQKQNLQIQLDPNQQHIILFKIGNENNGSHKLSFSSKSNFQTKHSNRVEHKDQSIQNIIDNGAKKQRQGRLGNINVNTYTLKTNEGFQILLQNKEKKLYQENLTFKTLENLNIVPQNMKDLSGKTVQISIKPNSTYLIQLKLKNPANQASKYSCSYVII